MLSLLGQEQIKILSTMKSVSSAVLTGANIYKNPEVWGPTQLEAATDCLRTQNASNRLRVLCVCFHVIYQQDPKPT
jgi:hypothetical protein